MKHTVPKRSNKIPFLRRIKFGQQVSLPFIILLLTLLACNIRGQDAIQDRVIIKQLPTLTATIVANLLPEPETSQIANPTPPPAEANLTPLTTPIEASTSDDTSGPIEQAVASEVAANEAVANEAAANEAVANEAAPAPTQTIEAPIMPPLTETPIPPTLTPVPATATPLPAATATPMPDWSFAAIRTYYSNSSQNLSIYGDVINNTGTSQKVALITVNFYDEQSQLIAATSDKKRVDYWPSELIPAGERLPFSLKVLNIEFVADFELSVEAQPIEQMVHQDLEFSDVSEGKEFGQYCLQGRLRNVGSPLQKVVIMGVLYNDQDQMLQFGEHKQSVSGIDLAAQPLEFEICFNLNNPNLIARHELRAWGQ